MADEELLNSTEVAELLRVHPKHLYRLLRQGLPGHRVGRGHWRFDRDEVLAWVRAGRPSAGEREAAAAASRARAPLELELCTSDRSGRRFALGRIGERWVGHPLVADDRRADALFVEGGFDATVIADPCAPLANLANNVLAAGCASVLGLVLDGLVDDHPGEGRGRWIPANSTTALRWLARGQVHCAGVHLCDPTVGRDHAALVAEVMGERSCQLIHLFRWRLGLVVRDDRLGVNDVRDLAREDLRVALRERGSGAMEVLARALSEAAVELDEGRAAMILSDHQAVAQAVALGAADVGVAVEPVARARGLAFIPLVEEAFELVIPDEQLEHPGVASFVARLDRPLTRREIATLGPYDTGSTGHATTVCGA